MTTQEHRQLDPNEVLARLQDCFNYLVVAKAGTEEPEEKLVLGYYQRGLIEAKRIIKEGIQK